MPRPSETRSEFIERDEPELVGSNVSAVIWVTEEDATTAAVSIW
jgi:hypothetical protein